MRNEIEYLKTKCVFVSALVSVFFSLASCSRNLSDVFELQSIIWSWIVFSVAFANLFLFISAIEWMRSIDKIQIVKKEGDNMSPPIKMH